MLEHKDAAPFCPGSETQPNTEATPESTDSPVENSPEPAAASGDVGPDISRRAIPRSLVLASPTSANARSSESEFESSEVLTSRDPVPASPSSTSAKFSKLELESPDAPKLVEISKAEPDTSKGAVPRRLATEIDKSSELDVALGISEEVIPAVSANVLNLEETEASTSKESASNPSELGSPEITPFNLPTVGDSPTHSYSVLEVVAGEEYEVIKFPNGEQSVMAFYNSARNNEKLGKQEAIREVAKRLDIRVTTVRKIVNKHTQDE